MSDPAGQMSKTFAAVTCGLPLSQWSGLLAPLKMGIRLPFALIVPPTSFANIDVSVGPRGELLSRVVQAALQTLAELLPQRTVGIYVELDCLELRLARISEMAIPRPADEYSLELRFASWLNNADTTKIQAVPTYLRPWLPLAKAMVVPLLVDGYRRGAIVADTAGLARTDVQSVEQLAMEIADRLAELERQIPHGVGGVRERFGESLQRIRLSKPP